MPRRAHRTKRLWIVVEAAPFSSILRFRRLTSQLSRPRSSKARARRVDTVTMCSSSTPQWARCFIAEAQGLTDNTLVIFTSDNGAVVDLDVLETGH
jgi:hypothetical protein